MNRIFDRLPLLKRTILAKRTFAVSLAWSMAAVLVPLGVRIVIDGGKNGVPFATFYPAVMLAALLLGWRWGAVVTLGSAIAANRVLMHRPLDVLDSVDLLLIGLFFLSGAILVATAELARKLVWQLEAANEREKMLKGELLHRVKNMFATVAAMAAMTARHSPPEKFREALTGRLDALQRATGLLGADVAESRGVAEVLDNALRPFRTDDNFSIAGAPCLLPGAACVPLSLALHELCTNAVKYGALSVDAGRVEIRWQFDNQSSLLLIDWSEHGGPPVVAPTHEGMGTRLLHRQHELGDVVIDYAPNGLTCRMSISGATISA